MSRPRRNGLEYFPMDAGFLRDVKIETLMSRKGPQALTVYMAILSRIYEEEGYFVLWDEDNLMSVSRMAWCTQEYVDDVIEVCLEKGLFSAEMYANYGILTSAGVQRRYLKAIKERIRRLREVGLQPELKRSIWLLSEKETTKLKIEMGLNDGITTADAENYANEEEGFFPEESIKKRERKEKEEKRKEKQRKLRVVYVPTGMYPPEEASEAAPKADDPPPQEWNDFELSKETYDELCTQYGKQAVDAKRMHLQDWVSQRGAHLKNPEIRLRAWLAEDAHKEQLKIEAEERAARRAAEQPAQFKKTSAHAYEQRQYTEEELEAMLDTDWDHLND